MMSLEEIRKQLEELNFEHAQIVQSENMKNTLHKGLPDDRGAVKVAMAFNPELLTWDDHHRKIANLEEQIVEFGIAWWEQIIEGQVIAASYVLIPKNEGSKRTRDE